MAEFVILQIIHVENVQARAIQRDLVALRRGQKLLLDDVVIERQFSIDRLSAQADLHSFKTQLAGQRYGFQFARKPQIPVGNTDLQAARSCREPT